jgi:hypothetical protein
MASPSDSHPTHIYAQQSLNAGRCLFTSKEIGPGDLAFRIDHPLVLALNAPRLRDTCERCLLWMGNGYTGPEEGNDREVAPAGEHIHRLRDCQGCKVVRYCGKVSVFRSVEDGFSYLNITLDTL